VVIKRLKSDVRNIADSLRQANLRYSGIRTTKDGFMLIKFRDANTRNNAQSSLTTSYPDYLVTPETEGADLYLKVGMSPAAITELRNYTMTQTVTVLRNRIDALGVAEPSISRQGADRIVVELPGIQDMALAKQMLGGTATLEFHMVDSQHDVQSAVNGMVPLGSRVYHMSDGSPILLKNQIVLSGNSITFAAANFDQSGQPSVNIRTAGSQVSTFNRITSSSIGQRMAIVYVETKNTPKLIKGKIVNVSRKVERVISAPVIQGALGNNFQITGLNDVNVAKNLAIQLKSGALPANMYPIQEKNVGPSLGAANIHRGIISVIAGFVLIVLFMALYYRFMGLLANLALFTNVVLIVAVMSIIGVTMTLPGIAAVVLTMGMAVDANVLIFERIREELHNGSTIQAAIHAGYERAFTTIVDANITTLIVAMALFAIGTGAIQGFAVTLIIGLVTSMITAIMGTRAIVNLVYGNRPVKKISIGM
jgi:preprotein translocase subunit SecD